MKKTEVTQDEWRYITERRWQVEKNPSYFTDYSKENPVERVSWYDAIAYCNILSAIERIEPAYILYGIQGIPGRKGFKIEEIEWIRTSSGYRLPTEAEWEYACRAGTLTSRYEELDKIAWYADNSLNRTHEVGQMWPNDWGLYDMLGNVFEWVYDNWQREFSEEPVTDPVFNNGSLYRILRGGSWDMEARIVRADFRFHNLASEKNKNFGFRCCRSLIGSIKDMFLSHRETWIKQTEEGLFENPRQLPIRRRGKK